MSSSKDQSLQRWRFDIAYDGEGFYGFAFQPHHDTVVGLFRSTLQTTLNLAEAPQITGAGRTDTGVHALAQVIHVDLPTKLFKTERGPDDERLMRSLNKQLRGRIRVLAASPVSETFHARYSAKWREYRYIVLESRPPALTLDQPWSWSVEGPLNVAAMNRAGKAAIGTHDFRAFCRKATNQTADDPILRKVLSLKWHRVPDAWQLTPEGEAVILTIRAQSFCHNMVRCLTSTMVHVGLGDLDESIIAERLASLDRSHLPPPAPPTGLALINVGY